MAQSKEEKRKKHAKYMREVWYPANKEKHVALVSKVNERRRKTLTEKLNSLKVKCKYCYETCHVCLDFHHIDPKKKELNVSNMKLLSHDRVMKEIAKCEVVCANCHRKLHAGLIAL